MRLWFCGKEKQKEEIGGSNSTEEDDVVFLGDGVSKEQGKCVSLGSHDGKGLRQMMMIMNW